MYKPEWLPYISVCEHFFYQAPCVKPFCPLARSRKREQSQGGRGKPLASGILVLELLVLTSMANSKPTNSQPPIQFSALVSLFTPVHGPGQLSSLFSCQFTLKLPLILFFMKYPFFFSRSLFYPLDPCNSKPFPTPKCSLCLIHLYMYFILTANSIKSLKAEIILLCLTLRRPSVNACRTEMNWIWRIWLTGALLAVFFM